MTTTTQGASGPISRLLLNKDSDLKLEMERHTTASAADTITTNIQTVLAAGATLESDPVAGALFVTAVPSLTDRTFTLKTWKPTAAGNTAPTAATTFGKVVNWWAVGI